MTDGRSIVVLCVCFMLCTSYIAESKNIPKAADPGDGCKVKNKFYRVGESWSPKGICQQNTCLKGGAIGGVICPLVSLPEDSKCYLTEEDVSKGWPDCCGTVKCPHH